MRGRAHHAPSLSGTVNHRAQLANAYQELGKELASQKIRVVGNYTLGKVIGEGWTGPGYVRMGTHRLTSTRVAIKQIPKEFSAQLTREIHHHRRLHHPHVTQLYEVIATESSIWLVTELCSGGELFDYLVEKGRLSESESRRLVGQLCLALHYVHSSKAVHRDLKLENVLLDDRCNVKIGDFGFTREYENGRLLETFCGTTGYAAPEMLIGQKYSGPEVDIWSLGIILYALVTGTLPYDDDDEEVMKAKIIAGDFEIPDWLSTNLQDLIRGILQKHPVDRLSIPQILAHTWFSQTEEKPLHSSPFELNFSESPHELNPDEDVGPPADEANPNKLLSSSDVCIPITPAASESSSSTPDTDTANYASSDIASSDLTTATTPEKHSSPLPPPFQDDRPLSTVETLMHRSWSESTLGKGRGGDASSKPNESSTFAAVPEEDTPTPRSPSRSASMKSKASAPPSAYPTRTPVRTKRRSVTSNISAPTSPTEPTPLSNIETPGVPDYAGLIAASAPIMFSTPLERELLNTLSMLGFDTGQIVHSVLTDACDSTGAIWWLLKRKAERREIAEARRIAEERRKTLEALGDSSKRATITEPLSLLDTSSESQRPSFDALEAPSSRAPSPTLMPPATVSKVLLLQEDDHTRNHPPQISFVPPTPTAISHDVIHTPSRTITPSSSIHMSIGQDIDTFAKSAPTSPLTSKDKDKDKGRAGKPRSGSVSMLQRAAGALVRKKSEEKVKEKDRDKDKDDGGDPGKMSLSRPSDSTSTSFSSLSSPSPSHSAGYASGSNKLTKSPPPKGKDRDADEAPRIASVLTPGSPWVAPASTAVHPLPSRPSFKFMQAESSSQPNDDPQLSALNADPDHTHSFAEAGGSGASKGRGQRASILHTFRTWFQEDKKKKTKPVISPLITTMNPYFHGAVASNTPLSSRSGTYRGGRKKGGTRRHDKRASISSHRSSSVNSRRSSVTSIQQKRPAEFVSVYPSDSMPSISRQRSDASRLSFGSRTPTSEMGSRPSSIRSFKVTSMGRHSRRANSPSQSSMGSGHGHRTASPSQHYHRRVGSGSSGRVIRQIHTVHHRSNSAASSIRSVSRPGSFGEVVSDTELGGRASPLILDKKAHTTTVFVAHKQGSVFGAPSSRGHSTVGRSSWKKSWGVEPPGWSSRTSHAAGEIETLSDPGHSSTVRDVFTGRQSLDPNDDSDWVDEDDDIPAFVGGLGQLPAVPAFALNTMSSSGLPPSPSLSSRKELPLIGNTRSRSAKRTRPVTAPSNMSVPSEIGRSSTLRSSPTVPLISLAADHGKSPSPEPPHSGPPSSGPRARRQLPSGRSGPSFRHAIQEEDEGEEE